MQATASSPAEQKPSSWKLNIAPFLFFIPSKLKYKLRPVMGGVTKIAMAAFILDVAAKILVNLMLPFSADNELGAFVNIFAVKKIGFGELILIPLFFFIVIKLQTKGFVNYIPWTLKWAIGINFGAATSAYLERLCRGGETYWFFNNHTGAMSLWG